mgnify:CR=1 FL=1
MTIEIKRESWRQFFDGLTKRRFDWQTRIEVLNDDIGHQILDDGLPLGGITCEESAKDMIVEIFVGTDDHHQTHSIKNPTKIAYLGEEDNPAGVVEIEEADGTKTLIHIIGPMPIVTKYVGASEATAA